MTDQLPTRSLRPAFDRLVEIAKLEGDWDSYGGSPPTTVAVASAGRFIVAVTERLGETVTPHSVMPFPDGGVQISWRRPSAELQIDVGPAGAYGYLQVVNTDEERRACEANGLALGEAIAAIARFLR